MEPLGKRSGRPSRRAGRPRDLLFITLVLGTLFALGVVTGFIQRIHDRLSELVGGAIDEVFALVALIAVGLTLFSLRRWSQARREDRDRAETQVRFQALVEQIPAIFYTWDPRGPTGTISTPYVSPQIEGILGYTPEEWTSDPGFWIRRLHPDDRDRVVEASNLSDSTGTPFALEYRMLTRENEVVWIRDESSVVAWEADGTPALVQGVMFDVTASKRGEELLRAAENKYRTLVEQLPVVTYVAGEHRGEPIDRYIAPQIEQLLGVSKQEWEADPGIWERQLHTDDRDRVLAESAQTDLTGGPFSSEYRLLAKDGRVVWVRDEAVCVELDAASGRTVWQGVFVDVTRRKEAEEKLLDAELKYRLLIEQSPVITYTESTAFSNDLPYVSPQIETILGYTPEEWMSDPQLWARTLHPDNRERVLQSHRRSAETGEPFIADYRCISKDGREVWMHNEARLVRDENGRPRFWQGLVMDITERKQAEQRLAAAEAKYRALVEQIPVVVYANAVDEVSTALYMSPQYEQLLGYTVEERLAEPDLWIRLLHPEDRERAVAESIRTNATGDPFRMEYRLIAKDGRTVWVRDESFPVRDENGVPVMWQGVLLDITERKLAEETLARRDAILEAVGFAAERFLKTSSWHDTLPEVFQHLGEAARASRVYLFENEPAEDGTLGHTLREEWLAPGIPSVDDETNRRASYQRGFSRWAETLTSGDAVCGLIRDFPESERMALENERVLSMTAVPVFVGTEWWGFLGFDDCVTERSWPQPEIEALRTAADTLGAAIERQRAYRSIREAEARYRTLVETIPAAVFTEDSDDTLATRYVSPQIEAISGYPPERWMTDPGLWPGIIHPDDRERVLAENERVSETEEPFNMEFRLVRPDDSIVWIHDEAVLIRDEEGLPLFWQGFIADITAQKEAEEQLREAEARFRTLVEAVPAITYIDAIDERATSLYVSPQVQEMLGYTPEEWQSDPDTWIDALHPDERERVLEAVRLHMTGRPFVEEYRLRTKDGRWRWINDQALVLRDDESVARFSQGVMFDITERKEAEQALRETEERYRVLVEHIPAVLYVELPDEEMTTVYVSPQIEEVLGISQDEFLGATGVWARRVHEEDLGGALEAFREGVQEEEPFAVEYRWIRPDGKEIWIRDEAALLHDDRGERRFMQGVMFDITERRHAEETLRESEQREREAAERLRTLDEMKNAFLAAVSHELRSPLTSILGLALTLERQETMSFEDQSDLLGRLASNARKLDRLLKDLLDIDRLNRGIVTPNYRQTDVGLLARRIAESLDVLGGRNLIVQSDPVIIPVDPAKVERIVENLLANAARHTVSDASIWLRVAPADGGALIAIEDDGPGVPKELREAIFEPFRQGPTASPHAPGTGIGLSLVTMFADLHGGRAWVQDREGGGASFRVFLPGRPRDENAQGDRTHDDRLVG